MMMMMRNKAVCVAWQEYLYLTWLRKPDLLGLCLTPLHEMNNGCKSARVGNDRLPFGSQVRLFGSAVYTWVRASVVMGGRPFATTHTMGDEE
jgi:hypothetical protein